LNNKWGNLRCELFFNFSFNFIMYEGFHQIEKFLDS
jgi:hypothetical protein